MSSVTSPCLTLLIILVGLVLMSLWAMTGSLQAGDPASAIGWATIFLGASLVGAWCFWRLV